MVERHQEKEKRLAARKQALADRPNPFLKEIETCERLVAYCELLKKKLGLQGQTDEVIKEEQKQIINQLAKEDVQKKLKDGKIEVVMSKKEREEAAIIRVGGKQKGKKEHKQAKHREDEDVFSNIDISLLNLFGFLKVSPPLEQE